MRVGWDPESFKKAEWDAIAGDDNVVPLRPAAKGRAATQLRYMLQKAGYAPIPVNGKKPPIEEWQKKLDVSREEINSWTTFNARNTGLLCERTPAIDIDILDAAAADAVEQLIRHRFKERGAILVRTGRYPKRLIPFRTAAPFTKITAPLVAPNGNAGQKIEFLGKGQHFSAFGTHPDTHKPYQWNEAGQPGGIKLEQLPEISGDEAKQLVDDVVELLIEKFGYQPAGDEKEEKKSPFADFADSGNKHLDWKKPIKNILVGVNLHDNIRDLAASLVTSNVSVPAAEGILKALMHNSAAEHDERWQDRFDDISRAVKTAVKQYQDKKEKEDEEAIPEFPLIDIGAWVGKTPPLRVWVVADRVPARVVTALYGDGGVGKTILLLQLAVCVVLGIDWLGAKVTAGPVLIMCCEDDPDELWRRLEKIAAYYNTDIATLKARGFHIASFAGKGAAPCGTTKGL